MNKNSSDTLTDKILNVLAHYSNGASLLELTTELDSAPQKRTIQRHIKRLKEEGRIFSHGRGRMIRYFIRKASNVSTELMIDGYIPISKQGEAIRHHISKPLSERKSVTYNQDFLYDYIPNKSFYLKPETLEHLKKIGKQPDGTKPAATFANQILNRLLVDLSWNSSRLEGNTYSLLETGRLVEFGEAAEGKAAFETRMILNHKAAIEFLVELGDDLGFNPYIILNLHALLSYNLLGNPNASGRLRSIPVSIGKTAFQPVTIPQLVEEYFKKILETADAIEDPFEQSFFAMVHLPYLQSFIDVNKRVSRLSANIPLIKHNYCPISFINVPKQAYIDGILGVYELNEVDLLADVYVWAYERSTLRYSEARAYLSTPDTFIEQFSTKIEAIVAHVVQEKLSKKNANKTIAFWAEKNISDNDRSYFVEVVETELLALHEGNIARYKIKPEEFKAWQKLW